MPPSRRAAEKGDSRGFQLRIDAGARHGHRGGPGRGLDFIGEVAASIGEAWFELGNLHRLGRHVRRDPHAAISAYRKAAEKGHVRAQCALGNDVQTGFVEQDLYAVAFNPNFSENGFFYVHYDSLPFNGDAVIVRFQVDSASPDVMSPERTNETAKVLMRIEQPWYNRNGGQIEFGPDGSFISAPAMAVGKVILMRPERDGSTRACATTIGNMSAPAPRKAVSR